MSFKSVVMLVTRSLVGGQECDRGDQLIVGGSSLVSGHCTGHSVILKSSNVILRACSCFLPTALQCSKNVS